MYQNTSRTSFFLLAAQEEEERQQKREEQFHQEMMARMNAHRIWQLRYQDNVTLFLETEGLFQYDPKGSISTRALYALYEAWCIREKLPIHTFREFAQQLKSKAPSYALSYSQNIRDPQGKLCRGFRGIRVLPEGDTPDTSGA